MKINPITGFTAAKRTPTEPTAGSERDRIRKMAAASDMRLTRSTATLDQYSPVHHRRSTVSVYFRTDDFGKTDRFTYAEIEHGQSKDHTDSVLVVGTWFEQDRDRQIRTEMVFEYAAADGQRLRLDRVRSVRAGREVQAFYMRLLDRHGTTPAVVELDRIQLHELQAALEGISDG